MDNSSKSTASKKEEHSRPRKAFTTLAIVVITIALVIAPWIIYQYTSAISAALGYTGQNFCTNPYVYKILIGIAVVLSVFSLLVSWLLVKGSSHWKVFMLFEAPILLNTFIAAFLQSSLCTNRSWNFF